MAWLFGAAGAGTGRARGVASPRRRNEAEAVAESLSRWKRGGRDGYYLNKNENYRRIMMIEW